MNKRIKLMGVLLFFTTVIITNTIFASTITYEREDKDNYGAPSDVVINSSNKNAALKTPLVSADEKVYDFAELLTDDEEEELYIIVQEFIENYDMDMAIVTIDYNNKYSQVEYADDFYDYNDFGIGANRDGLLFLIDMDNRKMHISTRGEAIRMYDDKRIDDILDDAYDYISREDYYSCAEAFVNSSADYAEEGIPSSNANTYINEEGEYVVKVSKADKKTAFLIVTVIAGIITAIFVVVASGKHKVIKKAVQAKAYLVKGSFKLSTQDDKFITSNTSKVYDPPSSSSSGGGSSTHTSSSGSSHGGGSRSF